MRMLIPAVMVTSLLALPVQASAGLVDWLPGNAVEDAVRKGVEDTVKKSVEEAIVGALTGKTVVNAGKNGKSRPGPTPEASVVNDGDHRRLPFTGKMRFPVPEEKRSNLASLEVGPHGGYMDRFGSEWIPYRANGRLVAWRSNLSERGRFRLGRLAGEHDFVLVDLDGKQIDVGG